MVSLSNATSGETAVKDEISTLQFGGIFLNTMSLFIVLVEVLSVYILHKCVLITDQIKIISQNLLVSDICFHFLHVLWYTVITPFAGSATGGLAVRLRIGIIYVLLLIYCFLMVVASFDRFISIKNPLHYELMFPPATVKSITRFIWITTLGAVLLPYIFGIYLHCGFALCGENSEPLAFNQYFRMTLSVLFLLCDICVAILYAFIMFKSGEQAVRIRRWYPMSKINVRLPGRRIMLIVGAFIVLYSPCVIYTVVFDLFQMEASFVVYGVFYVTGFRVCTAIHSFISLYFFMYSMPECRMRFMSTFLAWSKRFTRRTDEIKVQLFNIPIVQKY